MMTSIISFGVLLAFALVIFCTIKWWNLRLIGPTPVSLFTFIAILFTSGLDVGLIMFPLAFMQTSRPNLRMGLPIHWRLNSGSGAS